MDSYTIVALAGRKQTGKTTSARYLAERYGFVNMAFADPVYAAVGAAFDLDPLSDEWQENRDAIVPGTDKSLRFLLKTLGTEWGRDMVGSTVWVDRLEARIRALPSGSRVVVSDVRFDSEVEWVRRHGTLLHIDKPGAPVGDTHISERGVPSEPWDFRIMNNGSLAYLYRQLAVTMHSLDISSHHEHAGS